MKKDNAIDYLTVNISSLFADKDVPNLIVCATFPWTRMIDYHGISQTFATLPHRDLIGESLVKNYSIVIHLTPNSKLFSHARQPSIMVSWNLEDNLRILISGEIDLTAWCIRIQLYIQTKKQLDWDIKLRPHLVNQTST